MAKSEPLLQENKDRFVIFPVKHHDIWDWYKQIEGSFWTAEEIDLHQDVSAWDKELTVDERHFIKHILAFFAASGNVLKERPAEKFVKEVQYPEAKFFYGFQNMMENIHAETYSLLLDTYTTDEKEKKQLCRANEELPFLQKKAQWYRKWLGSDSFAERLVAFVAQEGIFFSGAFRAISLLQNRGLLAGLSSSTQLISRDKEAYGNFAVHLHNNHLINKVPKERIREILTGAHKIEKEFITDSLPVNLIGVNLELMEQYLEFVTDRLLEQLDCEKEYSTTNPFELMDEDNHQAKTNIVEKRAGEFRKAGVMQKDSDKINFKKDL